jgi:hypothetical protein
MLLIPVLLVSSFNVIRRRKTTYHAGNVMLRMIFPGFHDPISSAIFFWP